MEEKRRSAAGRPNTTNLGDTRHQIAESSHVPRPSTPTSISAAAPDIFRETQTFTTNGHINNIALLAPPTSKPTPEPTVTSPTVTVSRRPLRSPTSVLRGPASEILKDKSPPPPQEEGISKPGKSKERCKVKTTRKRNELLILLYLKRVCNAGAKFAAISACMILVLSGVYVFTCRDPHPMVAALIMRRKPCPEPFAKLHFEPEEIVRLMNSEEKDIIPSWDLNGCHPKFWIQSTTSRVIWKPTAERGPSTEAAAYAVDRMLGLERVPPALLTSVRMDDLEHAIHDNRAIRPRSKRLKMCKKDKWGHMEVEMFDNWIHSVKEKGDGASIGVDISNGEKYVLGSAVEFVPDLHTYYRIRLWARKLAKYMPYYEREYGTRDMFDYLIGNIDRGANEFYVNGVFLYADHDKLVSGPIPMRIRYCRVHKEPYMKLKSLVESGKLAEALWQTFQELNRDVLSNSNMTYDGVRLESLLRADTYLLEGTQITRRAENIVEFVEDCLRRKGEKFVFCG